MPSNRDNKDWKRRVKSITSSVKDLAAEMVDDPKKGFYWWKTNRAQADRFKRDRRKLVYLAATGRLDLMDVYRVFSRYNIKPDDEEIVRWFGRASEKLHQAVKQMKTKQVFPEALLKEVIKELTFLRTERAFFFRYRIEPILGLVNAMFKEINQRLAEFTVAKKQQLEVDKQNAINAEKEKEVKALEAKVMQSKMEKEKLEAIKAKRAMDLQLVEEKRMAAEAKVALIEKEHEAKTAEDARQRAKELTESYERLQIDNEAGTARVAEGVATQLDKLADALQSTRLTDAEKDKAKKLLSIISQVI